MNKSKIVTKLAAAYFIIVVVISTMLVNSVHKNKSSNINQDSIDGIKSAFELKQANLTYAPVVAGEDAVIDENGQTIENLSIEAYFFDDDNNQVRGTCKWLNEQPVMHIKINASQFLGTLSNVEVKMPSNKNFDPIPTFTEGGAFKYVDSFWGRYVLNDMTGGEIVTIDQPIRQNVNRYPGTYKDCFTRDNVVTITGDYIHDGITTKFTKEITLTVDWNVTKDMDYLRFYNQLRDSGNLILNKDKEIIVNLCIESGSARPEPDTRAIDTYAEYKLEDLAVEGIKPTDITVTPRNSWTTISEENINYDEVNDVLTFKEVIPGAGEGSQQETYYHCYVTLVYPPELYQLVKDSDPVKTKTYTVQGQQIAFGNPKITYGGTYLIEGTSDEPGILYSGAESLNCTINFDVFSGELLDYIERLRYAAKVNTKVAYKDIEAEAGFIETWWVKANIGGKYIKKMKMQRDYYNEEDPYVGPEMAFENSQQGTMTSFEDSKQYTAIRISGNLLRMLGKNGKVKVYDAETNDLLLTIADEDKHIYDEPHKSIRIETTGVENIGEGDVLHYIKIDNESIVNSFTYEEFLGFDYINAGSSLYAAQGKSSTYKKALQSKGRLEYRDGGMDYGSDDIWLNVLEAKKLDFNVNLTTPTYLDAFADCTVWVNPKIIIQIPDEIKKITVKKGKILENTDLQVTSTKAKTINGKRCIVVQTKGVTRDFARISIPMTLTPNKELVTSNTVTNIPIPIYAYNKLPIDADLGMGAFTLYDRDIFDIDGDGNASELTVVHYGKLNFLSPTGVATTTKITYTSGGEPQEVLCPDVGDLSAEDTGRKATVEMDFWNLFNGTVSNLKIIGKTPFEGNSFVKQGDKLLNSTFTATMDSTGITIPTELVGKANVYYSENDVDITNNTTYMDISDESYGWRQASDITDWSKIKSYVIVINEDTIPYGADYTFSYKVNIPSDVSYGEQTFATHAIECGLSEENGAVTYNKTETNKVGIRINTPDNANVTLTKVKEDGETELNGVRFKLTRVDGGPVQIDDNNDNSVETEKTFTATPNFTMESLYPNVQYKLEEVETPEDYLPISPIKFTIVKDNETYKLNVDEGTINGNITSEVLTDDNGEQTTTTAISGGKIVNELSAKYTVIYNKGTHGTFDDDTHPDLRGGIQTPGFVGQTTHEPGYKFTGWIEEGTTALVQDADIANTVVTKDTKYIAQWEPDSVNYKIEFFYEVDGQYPTSQNGGRETRTSVTGTTVNATENDKTSKRDGYEFDSTYSGNVLTGEVAGDGSLVLKVYFKEKRFGYGMDLIKLDSSNANLSGTSFKIYRENAEVFSGNADANVELNEQDIRAGIYYYYITETQTAGNKYANILNNKYIKLIVKVDTNGEVTILDENGNVNDDYFEVYSGDITATNKSNHTKVEDVNITSNIAVRTETINSKKTIQLSVKNPVKFQVDVITKDTSDNILDNTNVVILNESNRVFAGEATQNVEYTENIANAKLYNIIATQTSTKNDRFVNVLEGKAIKAPVTLAPNGTLTIGTLQLLEGDINNPSQMTVVNIGNLNNYVKAEIVSGQDIDTLKITIIDPVKFDVEVDKVDSSNSPLKDTEIEISSPIINEQNAAYENERISGITSITNDGKVNGKTTEVVDNGLKARVSYGETWVNANENANEFYTYRIKETKTAGSQYVNILQGYEVVVRTHIDADGTITLVDKNGNAYAQDAEIKYTIEDSNRNEVEVTNSLYTYVNVQVNNNTIKATLNAQVENPVQYNVAVHESIYGQENIPVEGMPVQVSSGFSGIKTLTTDENGNSSMTESPVRANEYEYVINQLTDGVSDEFVNILDGYYVKVDLNVHSNGDIKTISSDGDETTVSYKLYKEDENGQFNEVNFNDTIVDEFVKVKVTKDAENVCTLNVYIQIPQKYDFRLIKSDIDTLERLNNVEFSIVARDEQGEVALKDAASIKDEKTGFTEINTKNLKTTTVNDEEGIIELRNILIEKAGTYTFTISETTPQVEGLVYKDKAEDIVVQAVISVKDGKYEVESMNVLQGGRYTENNNTVLSGEQTKTLNVNVTNERVKGSYDLILNKVNEFTGKPLDGAVYKVTAEKDGFEKILYVSDGNVLSLNEIIPYTGDVEASIEGTSTTQISNIRIDTEETYTIKIEEIKAPEGFTKLDEIVELEVTTAIEGVNDDARYVLKDINLKEGNHNLVSETHTENKLNVQIINDYFDLSLRQYVSSINGKEIEGRNPTVKLDSLNNGETTAEYLQTKEPQRAYVGDEIIYTIEAYNEGLIDGYAEEIVQYIPEGLEYVEDDFNKARGWTYDKNARKLTTNILSKESSEGNLIKAYDATSGKLDSKKVELKLKVADTTKVKSKLTTIAEITESLTNDRIQTLDRDSSKLVNIPKNEELANYKDEELSKEYISGDEDDDDFEKLLIEQFDLATVKYVKQVADKELKERTPVLSFNMNQFEDYKAEIFTSFKYKPELNMEKVDQNDKVIYGIRVYNEGTVPAYATEVKDNIPDGLIFDVNSEINKKYGWIMLDKDGFATTDSSKACYIVTNHLSKESEEKANVDIDETAVDTEMTENAENTADAETVEKTEKIGNLIAAKIVKDKKIIIDYRELEVEFKVSNPTTLDRTIENIAEVSKAEDDHGVEGKDLDSEEKLKENIEKIYVKVFDLDLQQEISSITVKDKNGKIIEQLNSNENKDIKKLAKIDIPNTSIDGAEIKVEYNITLRNTGEVSGYALEINDYIPSGFIFKPEDNPDWTLVKGVAISKALENDLINPGESRTLKIVLTWDGKSELGNMNNIAEIGKHADKYKLDITDIDSIPSNLKAQEDDIDATEVLLAVRTGSGKLIFQIVSVLAYLAIAISAITIIKVLIERRKE